jgi:protein-S-isoprenylcysteine O-methyltransferase Ste14
MSKPNYFGVGPAIARMLLPWVAATVLMTLLFPGWTTFPGDFKPWTFWVGLLWLIPGLIIYTISGRMLIRAVNEGRLITSGPYRFCRNPLYSMIILHIIPGVALMLNSWLMLTSVVVGYIAFKRSIREEYQEMEGTFGETYRDYCRKTAEFFPWCPSKA